MWKLYRGNWQGMVGLAILVVFMLMALLAPFLADHALLDPNAQIKDPATGELYGPYHPPTTYYYNWFGTDQVGQSVLAQFIWSARISLMVGLLAAFMSTVLGAGIGIAAGFYGGWQGEGWMRLTDAFLVIPWLPLADGAGRRLGSELLDDHPDHRHHQLARHRTRRALATSCACAS